MIKIKMREKERGREEGFKEEKMIMDIYFKVIDITKFQDDDFFLMNSKFF